MSSHHIIKEDQEPALLILELEKIDLESLGQLLEWSPTVMVSDRDYEALESQGIKVDILFLHGSVYDIDIQEHTRLYPIEDSFLREALDYLVDQGQRAVNVIAGAIDQALLLSYANRLDIVVLDDSRRAVIVGSPYEKWKPKGERIRVYTDMTLKTVGLTSVATNLFETAEEGFFKIEFEASPYLWVEEAR